MTREDLIKKEIAKSVGYSLYNGQNNRTPFGYHSYNIEEINITGQRNPLARISRFREHIDFNGKNVADFGCNVGAMLHHLPEIKSGTGFDYDPKCVFAAIEISKILKTTNLSFFVHDFDKLSYESLSEKITIKPDVIFLLSIGSWVKSWRSLYEMSHKYGSEIILETNNDTEGNPQLEFFRSKGLKVKKISDFSPDDILGNYLRKTYLISRD